MALVRGLQTEATYADSLLEYRIVVGPTSLTVSYTGVNSRSFLNTHIEVNTQNINKGFYTLVDFLSQLLLPIYNSSD